MHTADRRYATLTDSESIKCHLRHSKDGLPSKSYVPHTTISNLFQVTNISYNKTSYPIDLKMHGFSYNRLDNTGFPTF